MKIITKKTFIKITTSKKEETLKFKTKVTLRNWAKFSGAIWIFKMTLGLQNLSSMVLSTTLWMERLINFLKSIQMTSKCSHWVPISFIWLLHLKAKIQLIPNQIGEYKLTVWKVNILNLIRRIVGLIELWLTILSKRMIVVQTISLMNLFITLKKDFDFIYILFIYFRFLNN